MEPIEAVENTLLVSPLQTLDSSPHYLSDPISFAASKTLKTLRIVLVSPLFDPPYEGTSRGISHTGRWDEVQRLLTYVYVQATKVAQELDRVLMDIDVLLQAGRESVPESVGADAQRIFRGAYFPSRYQECGITEQPEQCHYQVGMKMACRTYRSLSRIGRTTPIGWNQHPTNPMRSQNVILHIRHYILQKAAFQAYSRSLH